jgi:hypothetical protein
MSVIIMGLLMVGRRVIREIKIKDDSWALERGILLYCQRSRGKCMKNLGKKFTSF